jgi:hypothetical protein
VTCIDRQAYLDATTDTPVEGADEVDVTDVEAAVALLGPEGRSVCPEFGDEAPTEDPS